MSLYYPGNARGEEQRAKMARLESAGICVFCPQHLADDPDNPVLQRFPHWTLVRNRYPYKGARDHLLLVPDDHVTDLADLPPEAQQSFWPALTWTRDHFASTHYGLGARNGDCRLTGGTVRHLHIHLLIGETASGQAPVRMKFSSPPGE